MEAGLAHRRARIARAAPVRMDVRDHFVRCALDPAPAGMDRFQEDEILGRMKCGDGAEAVIGGCLKAASRLPGARLQDLDASGLFGIGIKRAVRHEVLRVMLALTIVEDGLHRVLLKVSRSGPLRDRKISFVNSEKPSRS